jgi:hypothetical protein
MIDLFVILTPILVLAIVALFAFVGCFTKPAPPGPRLTASAGDQSVFLSWTDNFPGYTVRRGTAHNGPYTDVMANLSQDVHTFVDSGLTNGTEFFYVVAGFIPEGGGIFGDPKGNDSN